VDATWLVLKKAGSQKVFLRKGRQETQRKETQRKEAPETNLSPQINDETSLRLFAFFAALR